MSTTARPPQRAAKRRAEILDAARRAFAEDGVLPVSTHQVARAAGVSPGNLHYWFPTKAALVRALFAQWLESEAIAPADGSDDGILRALWDRAAEHSVDDGTYAFFRRDLLALLHTDGELAAAYRENYTLRRDAFVAIAERLVAAGLLRRPDPPATVQDAVSLIFLASETAGPFADATADPLIDKRRYARLVLEPLLTDTGRRALGLAEARPR
ncbi:TetR/AcrR family transcriptional regulator [Microbacterium sp.]|uniref:TetR/AcrR family transcriptional regulator n=1 Tax=Microbacterium sp. TaxID=51671 RepID=UPI003C71D0C0